mmetsp:Transcript_13540/g.37490  ORF Transcript_13540/g.37490 Transcript_13540/m.37490 type:complete len:218 (+) Transcript_13540:697-1350(+)
MTRMSLPRSEWRWRSSFLMLSPSAQGNPLMLDRNKIAASAFMSTFRGALMISAEDVKPIGSISRDCASLFPRSCRTRRCKSNFGRGVMLRWRCRRASVFVLSIRSCRRRSTNCAVPLSMWTACPGPSACTKSSHRPESLPFWLHTWTPLTLYERTPTSRSRLPSRSRCASRRISRRRQYAARRQPSPSRWRRTTAAGANACPPPPQTATHASTSLSR